MSDEEGLLAAIKATPDAITPRQMLSDLYRERGDDQRADAWAARPHGHSPFASLVGLQVVSVWHNDQRGELFIETPGRWFQYIAEGDCCSISWWYRFKGLAALIGHTVRAIAEGSLEGVDVEDGLCQQQYDGAYEYLLLTEAGACGVCFRNSSNGYYGGFLTVRQHEATPKNLGVRLERDWTHPPPESSQFACGTQGGAPCNCAQCLIPGAG